MKWPFACKSLLAREEGLSHSRWDQRVLWRRFLLHLLRKVFHQ